MKLKTFIGGIHPAEAKNLTEEKSLLPMPAPKSVVIPMSQHTGTPAKPIIEPKAKVKVGTKIGEAEGRISSSIHSSIAGTVKSIEKRFTPVGAYITSVIIESDSSDEWEKFENNDTDSMSGAEIVERVKSAGIVGLGGAAFPTHVKLLPPKDKPIELVILNGAECEPYLTGDYRLMLEKTKEIVEGGRLIMRAVGAQKGYIAIEDNKMLAVEKMREILSTFSNDFELCVVQTKYPEGGEKQLIQAITGREVPSGGLPFDVGCLVQNVGTAFAIYEACKFNKPLVERVVTVSGDVKEPQNLIIRIGTFFKDVIEFCGGGKDFCHSGSSEFCKIIMGGPMMGIAQPNLEIPVVKATSGILLQNNKSVSLPLDEPCIRCGECVTACPMHLMPLQIGDYIENEKFEEAKKIGLYDCMECGSCAWICPAKRNLVHLFKYGKIKAK